MKNIPEKIYLNLGLNNSEEIDDFKKLEGVSWCDKKIYEQDIEYILSEHRHTNHSDNTDNKALHISDVRLSLSNIQEAARISVVKTKKSKGMQNNKITERELELAERAYINGAIWAKNIIENNEA